MGWGLLSARLLQPDQSFLRPSSTVAVSCRAARLPGQATRAARAVGLWVEKNPVPPPNRMPLRTEKQARVSKCINPVMTKSAEPYRSANKLHVHGAGEASTEPDSLVPEDKPGVRGVNDSPA